MARNTKDRGNGSRRQHGGGSQQAGLSDNPVNDLLYDWITVLQSKAEGINAYEKYLRDAEEMGDDVSAELFRKFREQDIWQVKEIKQHLEQLILNEEEARYAGRGGLMHASRGGRMEEEMEQA
jgi:hypothetical protein